jgi:hypothetical protein
LARLRQHFWFELFATSVDSTDMSEVLTLELRRLIQIVCYAP